MSDSLFILASPSGPWFPTPVGCLFCIGILLAPLAVVAIALRSVLSEDPVRWWALAFLFAFESYVAYLLVSIGIPSPSGPGGFIFVWMLIGWGAILLAPAILIWESMKRGWFDFIGKGLKRIWPGKRQKRRRVRGNKPEKQVEPDHDGGDSSNA